MLQKVRMLIPESLWSFCDLIETTLDKKDSLTPPLKIRLQVGPFFTSKSYRKIAKVYVSHLIKYCNLKPNSKILDIGCGCGLTASELTRYLTKDGNYEGIDIVHELITWAQDNISKHFSNFHFSKEDIINNHYNPNGKIKASEYKFPFKNNSFDIVILTSVFTHMIPKDLEHYLYEVKRVLKNNGYSLISYFLLNLDLYNGSASRRFPYKLSEYSITNKDYPESAIAYREKYIKALYKKIGLHIKHPVLYGNWNKLSNSFHEQDIVIAHK